MSGQFRSRNWPTSERESAIFSVLMLTTDEVADSENFVAKLPGLREAALLNGLRIEAEQHEFLIEWLTRHSKAGSANG